MSSSNVLWLILLMSFIAGGQCNMLTSHNSSSAHCQFRTSPNFNSNIKEIFDQSSDLVYLTWQVHVEDKSSDYSTSYLHQDTDVIDPFTWVLARSQKGLRLLTFPFDYEMLSLGTLVPGVSTINPFELIIPKDQVDCFKDASDSDRLHMLADFFLSASSGIVSTSTDTQPPSICLERHTRRYKASAEIYLGTHVVLQMSSSYSCWSKNSSHPTLHEFRVDPSTHWLMSVVNLEPTWYLILFSIINMLSSIIFVFKSKSIRIRIERSDSTLSIFIRCTRFLSLAYFIPTVIFILNHFHNYCSRRDKANKFSTITRGFDVLHLILGVFIIQLPKLYRTSGRILSRKTLLTGFFVISVFISICLNGIYIAEVIYFTTLGLIINPKTLTLIVLQAIRSILFIRAVVDFHNYLRFEKDDRTLLSFIMKRATHLESGFFCFLSLLHTFLDPYLSPVTASLFAAAIINWIWYEYGTNDSDIQILANAGKLSLGRLSSDKRLKHIYHSEAKGVCFAGAYFDSSGGFLSIRDSNIGIFIQPEALDKETFVYISTKLNEDDEKIEDLERRKMMLISPVVTCGPPGLEFNKKVDLYIPSYVCDSSVLDHTEAAFCQTTSNVYQEWTVMDQHDVNAPKRCVIHEKNSQLTKQKDKEGRNNSIAIIRVKHFTRFALFGRSRSYKLLRVTCFGTDDTKCASANFTFRVWLFDDKNEAFKKVRKEEEELGWKRLLPVEKILVQKSHSVDISVKNIKTGWVVRDDNSVVLSCPNDWHSSRKNAKIALIRIRHDPGSTAKNVYCTVEVRQHGNVVNLKPEKMIITDDTINSSIAADSTRVKRSHSTFLQTIFGEVQADLGKLSVDAFYDILKSLGSETDTGCDWRIILQHIGEPNNSVGLTKQTCGNSYAAAKLILEYYLEEQCKVNGQFDPAESLKLLFQKLELHEPLRILKRDIGEDDEEDY